MMRACVFAQVGVCPNFQEGQCPTVFPSLINPTDQGESLSVDYHKGSSKGCGGVVSSKGNPKWGGLVSFLKKVHFSRPRLMPQTPVDKIRLIHCGLISLTWLAPTRLAAQVAVPKVSCFTTNKAQGPAARCSDWQFYTVDTRETL